MNQPQMTAPPAGGQMEPPKKGVGAWLWIVLVIVVLGAAGYFGWYYISQSKNITPNQGQSSNQNTNQGSTGSANGNDSISQAILSDSGISNGFSIGYLEKNTNTSRGFLPTVKAASITYSPVIFYAAFNNYIPQVYMYNVAENKETQITTDTEKAADKAVFSSSNQSLTYREYSDFETTSDGVRRPDYNKCKLIIKNMVTQKMKTMDRCIYPVDWSPDGKNLLTFFENYEIYNLESDSFQAINDPQGTDGNAGYHTSQWVDDNNLILNYRAKDDVKENTYKYELDKKQFQTSFALKYPNVGKVCPTAKEIYYTTTEKISSEITAKLAMQNLTSGDAEIISGANIVADFLVGYDSKNKPDKIVFSRSTNSQTVIQNEADAATNGAGIFTIDLGDKTIKRNTNTITSAATLIGWLSDFDHVLTMISSGSSGLPTEIHLINLKTGEDNLLFKTSGSVG